MFREEALAGWGRYPVEVCHVYRPERRSELKSLLLSGREGSFISRGLGRSYGDAALNADAGVVSHLRMNRMLGFDDAAGVLECEAGVSFEEILRTFLPRGFFLPVTPGTKFVTVGGAIANDVHGKNHHGDGTFAESLLEILLLTPADGLRVCSREKDAELFWATVGGLGLTGAIVSATFRLRRVESAYLRVSYRRTTDLAETLAVLGEEDGMHRYSVAWIDCLAKDGRLGRSVGMFADHAALTDLPLSIRSPLAPPSKRAPRVPFDLPAAALNRYSVRAFNEVYYRRHPDREEVVDVDRFFYPLDAVRDWNRIYGRRGFLQYQVVLPEPDGEAGLRILLERLSRSGRPSFLAVLKRFGEQNAGMLSFPRKGYTLALDLPADDGAAEFLRTLDEIVVRYGGRVYLGKDAVLLPEHFRAMYPRAAEFQEVKARVDPDGVLASSLARRLGLVDR
ncbi:MAG: FAD-binding oxidoreductase [Gemmatimonadota bacterium]